MIEHEKERPTRAPAGIWPVIVVILLAVIASLCVQLARGARLNPLAAGDDAQTKINVRKFAYAYRFALQNYIDKKTPDELYKNAMRGMLDTLGDPYSEYLDDAMAQNMGDTINGSFGGLGITINKRSADAATGEEGYVNVVAPMEDSPAYRAGVKSGDKITAVNGAAVAAMSSQKVLGLLRGKIGESVTISILRGDSNFDLAIVRAKIEVETVKHAMIGKTGYLRLIQFTPNLPDRAREALASFKSAGYTSLIIDVRGNPGGSLEAVNALVDDILDEGVIVSTKSRVKEETRVYEATKGTLVDASIPIAVLADKGSASASEILTGALKDHKRATIVGENTYGKASVQVIRFFDTVNMEGFKLTVAHYYTPNGSDINKTGVSPDIEVADDVPMTDENKASFKTLFESGATGKFLDRTPQPSDADVSRFVAEQRALKNTLPDGFLKRLLLREADMRMTPSPVYNLRYDEALNRALQVVTNDKS